MERISYWPSSMYVSLRSAAHKATQQYFFIINIKVLLFCYVCRWANIFLLFLILMFFYTYITFLFISILGLLIHLIQTSKRLQHRLRKRRMNGGKIKLSNPRQYVKLLQSQTKEQNCLEVTVIRLTVNKRQQM